jgi:hypothetical protein
LYQRVFAASGKPSDIARYVDGYRLFKRGEPWAICSEALAKRGPLDTRELALALRRGNGNGARLSSGGNRKHPFRRNAGK